jgi:hypothetical protein
MSWRARAVKQDWNWNDKLAVDAFLEKHPPTTGAIRALLEGLSEYAPWDLHREWYKRAAELIKP